MSCSERRGARPGLRPERRTGLSLAALALLVASASPPAPSLIRHTRDGLEKRRPSWSADGRRLAFARRSPDDAHLWQYLWDVRAGSAPRRLLADRETPHFDATFSPDGSRLLLAAVRFIGLQGNLDIAAVNSDGSGFRAILTEEGSRVVHQEWPAWSPDGKRFAFSSTHEGNQEIYTAAADGSDLIRLTQHPGHDAHPCWSPDGRRIAFVTDRFGGGLELAAVRPDGTGLVRLTDSPGLDDYPAYAPDGRRLAFVTARDGQLEIYIAAADGSHPANLTNHPRRDTFPTWTPDGRGVTFVSNRDGGLDLYTQSIESDAR
jgi:TolB protein